MTYPCFKLSQTLSVVKKLDKIKIIINEIIDEKRHKIDSFSISDLEKKNITKELNKKISLIRNKYNIIHNKLYNIINVINSCDCCINDNMKCEGGDMCLSQKENEEIWKEMDSMFEKISNFYDEIETKLVIELNLCLFKLNRIKKLNYLVA